MPPVIPPAQRPSPQRLRSACRYGATWLPGAPGVVLYHRDAIYLLDRLGVPLLGEIEPVPGVPPTASHLKQLHDEYSGREGIIIYPVFKSSQAPEKLAGDLDWEAVKSPLDPPKDADGDGYLSLIDKWVMVIASAKK